MVGGFFSSAGARCVSQTIVACHRLVSLENGSLTGLLRRTKTTGTDKNVSARLVRVDASSFVSSPQWLSAGWQILNELAPFQRDYLLPAPAGADDSCLRSELRYALGYATQTRLLASLVDSKGAKVLCSGRLTRGGHSSRVVRWPWVSRKRNETTSEGGLLLAATPVQGRRSSTSACSSQFRT